MLQRVFKMQVLWRATIYRWRGCLFATCLSERWNFRGGEANGDQKCNHVGFWTKENFRAEKMKHFSSFNALLIRLRYKACSGKCQYVWCMCRMCTWIVCEKGKREQAGSIVATWLRPLIFPMARTRPQSLTISPLIKSLAFLPPCHKTVTGWK